jgi:hypothetical protein
LTFKEFDVNIDLSKVHLAEKDIEDWLWENPQELDVFGIPIERWIGRQVQLPSGVADLIGIRNSTLVVVEVKNTELTADALTQVYRYAYDIEQMQGVWSLDRLESGEWEYEEFTFFGVAKVVIFKGGVSNKLLYEANALGVDLRSFTVSLSLDLGSSWRWTQKKRDEIDNQRKQLAHSGLFDEARDRALEIFQKSMEPHPQTADEDDRPSLNT